MILNDRFKYASDGLEVEDDLPWKIDEPTPWGEGYVVSNLKGEWITTKATRKANVLCQMPGKMQISFTPYLLDTVNL